MTTPSAIGSPAQEGQQVSYTTGIRKELTSGGQFSAKQGQTYNDNTSPGISFSPDPSNAAFVTAKGGTVSGPFNARLGGVQGGNAYFNVHTSSFAGGEIRGFLAPVPEPGTWALMGLGVAVMAGVAARRQRQAA